MLARIRAWWEGLFEPPPPEPAVDEKVVEAMDRAFADMERSMDQMSQGMDQLAASIRATGKPSGTVTRGSKTYTWRTG